MRLIDADALLEKAREMDLCLAVAVWDIENAPTVDAVEVVYCGECVEYRNGCCTEDGIYSSCDAEVCRNPNDFCSYGKRRGD